MIRKSIKDITINIMSHEEKKLLERERDELVKAIQDV